MVGSFVRFFFTSCEESLNSLVRCAHSFVRASRNSWRKIVRTHQPWSKLYFISENNPPSTAMNKEILTQTVRGNANIIDRDRRGSRGGETGEFSPPFFWASFFLLFFLSLKYWLVLIHYYKNSPPISKSWIRACAIIIGIYYYIKKLTISSVQH